MSEVTCDECGEDFDEDDEFACIEDGESICRWCNSEVSEDQ